MVGDGMGGGSSTLAEVGASFELRTAVAPKMSHSAMILSRLASRS